MEPFTRVEGIAAPFPEDDVNTDQVAPLSVGSRSNPDYSAMFFARRRNDPDFFFNKPQFSKPSILVTGINFGCGSSREAAVWALQAVGIRCVVARSFADIYRENLLQNGVLPIVLAPTDHDALEEDVAKADGEGGFVVDLVAQTLSTPDGEAFAFDISPADRSRLLEGLDDIGLTMKQEADILAFEARMKGERPWSQRSDANAL